MLQKELYLMTVSAQQVSWVCALALIYSCPDIWIVMCSDIGPSKFIVYSAYHLTASNFCSCTLWACGSCHWSLIWVLHKEFLKFNIWNWCLLQHCLWKHPVKTNLRIVCSGKRVNKSLLHSQFIFKYFL